MEYYMERRGFDNVKREKEKAIARFNRFRRIVKLWKFLEVLLVFALISWSSGRSPAVLKTAGGYFLDFSNYLFNHHVVFLIGNAIVVLLFMLCRQNDANASAAAAGGVGGDFYDDYVKYSEAAHQREVALPSSSVTEEAHATAEESVDHGGGGDDEKQIVMRAEETEAISISDDVAAAIEKATRQIDKFRRTQSEKLKREISVRTPPVLRKSETDNRGKTMSSRPADISEIETLSNDEFQRRVDAFIDKHWSRRTTKQIQFGEYENYRLTF